MAVQDAVDLETHDGPVTRGFRLGAMSVLLTLTANATRAEPLATQNGWLHASPHSAVLYWRLANLGDAAGSYVEYGPTAQYGRKTKPTVEPRWAQFHRLTGLKPRTTVHYRAVTVRGKEIKPGPDATFTTPSLEGWAAIPGKLAGPPYRIDRPGKYLLTADVTADAEAIVIDAAGVTLNLDGHTVTFGTKSAKQASGIQIRGKGMVRVLNGAVVQGDASGDYSAAVESRWMGEPREIAGLSITVQRPNGYPIKLFGRASGCEVHHNLLVSRVTEIESRHYPGNDLLRVDLGKEADDRPCLVHHNLLTGGCHRGISIRGESPGSKVFCNDIRHHAMYVNGYAIALAAPGIEAYGNVVTSTGRGMHLTRPDLHVHDNHLDIKGHATLDDLPAKSRPFRKIMVELHGIKLEGRRVTKARIHGNFVRIRQLPPDGGVQYVPATPLNVACYDPAAMNEIHDNHIEALTDYRAERFGGYGRSGQWASAIHFVGMAHGPAPAGTYSAYIHDNTFVTNHLHASADRPVTQTVRVEKNTFTLVSDPPTVSARTRFRKIGALEAAIRANNVLKTGTGPRTKTRRKETPTP